MALPWSQVPEVTSKSETLQRGWSIIWELPGVGERAMGDLEGQAEFSSELHGSKMPHAVWRFWHGVSWLKKIGYSQVEGKETGTDSRESWESLMLSNSENEGPWIGVIHHSVKGNGNGFTGGWTRSLLHSINNEWEDPFLKHWCRAVFDHGPHTEQHPALLRSPVLWMAHGRTSEKHRRAFGFSDHSEIREDYFAAFAKSSLFASGKIWGAPVLPKAMQHFPAKPARNHEIK